MENWGIDAEYELSKAMTAGATLPSWLIVHHSVTPRDFDIAKTESSINNNHKNRGFPKSSLGWYVGYHYMIFGNGLVKQYRRDGEMGAHTLGRNHDSIGICVIGSFDKGQETPSAAQIKSLTDLLYAKTAIFGIKTENIVPHRRFAQKSCYGSSLSDEWAKDLIIKKKTDMLVVKRKGSLTAYVISGNSAFPITGEAFKNAGGNYADIKELDDAEFWKFDVKEMTPIVLPSAARLSELKLENQNYA